MSSMTMIEEDQSFKIPILINQDGDELADLLILRINEMRHADGLPDLGVRARLPSPEFPGTIHLEPFCRLYGDTY